ncbi:MAG: GNAT family N-acetyltransferase [Solirubrobacteraceae bacterium]
MSDLRIVEGGTERIGDLEPRWRALYEHHRGIAEGVAGVRPFEDTWLQRRRQYRGWLEGDTDSVLLVAERDGCAVGYAVLTAGPGAATWDLGEVVAEIETLSVLPEERGSGVGAALMDSSRAWGRERGVRTILVGLAHTNLGARRFYEREGFTPFYLDMVLELESG